MSTSAKPPMRGVFPVVPTVFTERGELDWTVNAAPSDFMIDAGSQGLCILANCSEQFVLATTSATGSWT